MSGCVRRRPGTGSRRARVCEGAAADGRHGGHKVLQFFTLFGKYSPNVTRDKSPRPLAPLATAAACILFFSLHLAAKTALVAGRARDIALML